MCRSKREMHFYKCCLVWNKAAFFFDKGICLTSNKSSWWRTRQRLFRRCLVKFTSYAGDLKKSFSFKYLYIIKKLFCTKLYVRLSSSEKVSSLTFRYRFVAFATLGRRYLKGKNTMIIFERYAKWKYKLENRQFLRRGYYVSTVTYFYGYFILSIRLDFQFYSSTLA